MNEATPYKFKQCECDLCVRERKLTSLFNIMKDNGLDEYIDLIKSTIEDLDNDSEELDWIQSGMSKEFIRPEEVVNEFGISKEKMINYLEKRRRSR